MKKVVFTCLVLAGMSSVVTAQERRATPATTSVKAATTTAKVEMAQSSGAADAQIDSKTLTASQLKAADQKAVKKAKLLQTKLGLDAKQYDAVYKAESIFQREYDKWPAGKVPSGLLSNITSEMQKNISSVLTDSQREKYETIKAKTI